MITINAILKYGESSLEAITPDFKIDARLLLEFVLSCDRMYILIHKLDALDEKQESAYKSLINRRVSGEPLQYIVGTQEFMGLEFNVKPGVLIPRSDTEPLVEAIINRIGNSKSILDIGAGSGAIHVSLAYYLKDVQCVAVDISKDALEIASNNAKKLGVFDRVTYYHSDLFESLNERFDVIVSNPPYIPTEVIEGLQPELFHEPKIALDGGKDGYDFYRAIILGAKDYFNDQGLLAFEVGHDQSRDIKAMLEEAGYTHIEIIKDLSSVERVVLARYERL